MTLLRKKTQPGRRSKDQCSFGALAPQFYRPLTSLKILRIELVAQGSSHTIRLRMLLSQCDDSSFLG